jgi:hypothetical protein
MMRCLFFSTIDLVGLHLETGMYQKPEIGCYRDMGKASCLKTWKLLYKKDSKVSSHHCMELEEFKFCILAGAN